MALKEPLNHWMMHADKLASEFDATLRLSAIFGPLRVAQGDSVLTFYAPLTANVNSSVGQNAGTFNRASEGVFRQPTGRNLAIAQAGVSRHEYSEAGEALGIRMEPRTRNLCTNYNANPDAALSGFFLTGDPSAILTRVNDATRLQDSGLALLCTSGFVFQLDNSQGTETAAAYVLGGTQAQIQHQLSVYARKDPASIGNTYLRLEAISSKEFDNTERYEHVVHAETPDPASRRLGILCDPGAIAYFVLNQLENSTAPTRPIITEGASQEREVDTLTWPLTDALGREVFNQSQGMLACIWRPSFSDADLLDPPQSLRIVAFLAPLLYVQTSPGSPTRFQARGTQNEAVVEIASGLKANEDYLLLLHWGSNHQIGYKTRGVTTWGSSIPRGTYTVVNTMYLSEFTSNIFASANIRGLYMWNEDRGIQWLEDFFRNVAN